MLLMCSDPYARMQELIDEHEEQLFKKDEKEASQSANLIAFCRDTMKDLTRHRANRVSDEALALPPTHFFILNAWKVSLVVQT